MHLFSIKQPFTKRFPSPRRRCLVHAQVPTPCVFSRINTPAPAFVCAPDVCIWERNFKTIHSSLFYLILTSDLNVMLVRPI